MEEGEERKEEGYGVGGNVGDNDKGTYERGEGRERTTSADRRMGPSSKRRGGAHNFRATLFVFLIE